MKITAENIIKKTLDMVSDCNMELVQSRIYDISTSDCSGIDDFMGKMFAGRTLYEYTANDMEAANPKRLQTAKEDAAHLNMEQFLPFSKKAAVSSNKNTGIEYPGSLSSTKNASFI
jgi:hypothetical protein